MRVTGTQKKAVKRKAMTPARTNSLQTGRSLNFPSNNKTRKDGTIAYTKPSCIYPSPVRRAEPISSPTTTAIRRSPVWANLIAGGMIRLNEAIDNIISLKPPSSRPIKNPPTTAIAALQMRATRPSRNTFAHHHWATPDRIIPATATSFVPFTAPASNTNRTTSGWAMAANRSENSGAPPLKETIPKHTDSVIFKQTPGKIALYVQSPVKAQP